MTPPRTLILDVTMTHMRHVRSIQHTTGQLTHTRSSDGAPELNGDLQKVARDQIRQYRQIYLDKPDPIAFIPVAVDTSGRVYDDFDRLLFFSRSSGSICSG